MNKVLAWEDVKDNLDARKVLDHGFVLLKSVYGEDSTVCEAARISYGQGTKSVSDDRNLIRYLMRNRHTSPIEQCSATFIIKLPLFVMGQLVRHRTAKLNQYSGRYSEMPEEYFHLGTEWRSQSQTNKQGGESKLNYEPIHFEDQCQPHYAEDIAFTENRNRLEKGMARELARSCLPQSTYTICVWQMDIHNLCHFLKLRMDKHAQKEIRDYANVMYELVKAKFPLIFEAFDDYVLNARTFSAQELRIMKDLLEFDVIDDIIKDSPHLSKRELDELYDKLSYIEGL